MAISSDFSASRRAASPEATVEGCALVTSSIRAIPGLECFRAHRALTPWMNSAQE
jgi:hypothetical protein